MDINYKNHTIYLYGEDNAEGRHCVFAYCKGDKTFPVVNVLMKVLPKSTLKDESWRRLDEVGMCLEYRRNIKEHGPNEEQAALFDSLIAQCKF